MTVEEELKVYKQALKISSKKLKQLGHCISPFKENCSLNCEECILKDCLKIKVREK